jgi:hypothetical protein
MTMTTFETPHYFRQARLAYQAADLKMSIAANSLEDARIRTGWDAYVDTFDGDASDWDRIARIEDRWAERYGVDEALDCQAATYQQLAVAARRMIAEFCEAHPRGAEVAHVVEASDVKVVEFALRFDAPERAGR